MTRRQVPRYDEDEDNLFDALLDAEDDSFDSEPDDIMFYEDPEELDRMIEEEFALAKKRQKTRKRTR